MNESNLPDGVPEPGQVPEDVSDHAQEPAALDADPVVPPSNSSDAAQQVEQAVAGAQDAARRISDAVSGMSQPDLPDLEELGASEDGKAIGLLSDVELDVRIELGRTRMLVEDVLKLSSDAVVELDKAAGDPVDIYVNGRRIARGEVLVLNENFCVRVSEIVESEARTA